MVSDVSIAGSLLVAILFHLLIFFLILPLASLMTRSRKPIETITLAFFLPIPLITITGLLLDTFHAYNSQTISIATAFAALLGTVLYSSYLDETASVLRGFWGAKTNRIILLLILGGLLVRFASLTQTPLLTGDSSYYQIALAELTQTGHIGTHQPYFFISRPHVIPAGVSYLSAFPSLLLGIPSELAFNATIRFYSIGLVLALFCLILALSRNERWALWGAGIASFMSVTEIILLNSNAARAIVIVIFVYALHLAFTMRRTHEAILLGALCASMILIHDYMASQALILIAIALLTRWILSYSAPSSRQIAKTTHRQMIILLLITAAAFTLLLTPFLIKNISTYQALSAAQSSSVYHSSEAFNELTGITRNLLRFGLLIIPAILCIILARTRRDTLPYLPMLCVIIAFAIVSLLLGVNTILGYPILGTIWIMMAAPIVTILAARALIEIKWTPLLGALLILYTIIMGITVYAFCEKYWFISYDEYDTLRWSARNLAQEPYLLMYGDARLAPLIAKQNPLFAESVGHTLELDSSWLALRDDWIQMHNHFSERQDLLDHYSVQRIIILGLNKPDEGIIARVRKMIFTAINYSSYQSGIQQYYGQKEAMSPSEDLALAIRANQRWSIVRESPHTLIAVRAP